MVHGLYSGWGPEPEKECRNASSGLSLAIGPEASKGVGEGILWSVTGGSVGPSAGMQNLGP